MTKVEEVLIVDGYNVIGAAKTMNIISEDDFEAARDWLIEQLAEYQGYKGISVYLIFDAHMVPGIGRSYQQQRLRILYTKKNETADERIERLVRELKSIHRQIVVATSDYTEQRVIFAQGALRKSARELVIELKRMNQKIEEDVGERYTERPRSRLNIDPDLAKMLEKFRRGQ